MLKAAENSELLILTVILLPVKKPGEADLEPAFLL